MIASPFTPISSPHLRGPLSVPRIMFGVWAALLPATLFGIHQFGWPALNLLLVTVAATLAAEAICLRLAGKPVTPFLGDGSALLTAWLLAMSLPPWAPWWIGALGGLFAALLGKHLFGGIGQNLFNPAMLARVILLVAFPLEMTTWVAPHPLLSDQAPPFEEALAITFGGIDDLDAVSSPSILGHARTELARGVTIDTTLAGSWSAVADAAGTTAGSLGETSALLIGAGGLILLFLRLVSWQIPVATLVTVALLATLFHAIDPHRYADATLHLLSGGLLLGAFFIATDPVTSPGSRNGRLLFGAGFGALVYVIRTWGGYPEGVAFAVLIMNGMTPVIDHYLRPRIYGRRHGGAPIVHEEKRK